MRLQARTILFIVIAVAFGHMKVYADVSLSVNPSAPTADIVVSHFVGFNNFAEPWQWKGSTGIDHRDLGQSFLVPGSEDVYIDAVTLWARSAGSGVLGAAYTLEIWTVSNQADYSGDSLVSLQTGVLPSSGLTNGYWTFGIEDVQLTAGQYYCFILAFSDGPVALRQVDFVEDYSSGYANGRALGRAGTTWGGVTNDLCFWLQGSTTPPVPLHPLVNIGIALTLIATGVWAMRKTVALRRR